MANVSSWRQLTKVLDLGQGGFSGSHPDKRTGLTVVVLRKVTDFADAFSNSGKRVVSNRFLGNDVEEGVHLMDS